jgi:YrbI family 3-deoxy-D-manno-octulosonate 8-phosphate phosphatase
MNESILAVIPARGGSKGVPRKNLVPLRGRPLLTYSIDHALSARLVTRTVVSTEDAEIAEVARQWGAEVVLRPVELASDTASSESAILHVLSYLEESEHYIPDLVVFLQATSPLRQPDDIDNAISLLRSTDADSVFSAYPEHFVGRWQKTGDWAKPVNYQLEHRPRRQEYQPEYVENGSIYVVKTPILTRQGIRLGGKVAIYEMSRLDSFQIDTEEDFLLLEQLVALRRRQAALDDFKKIRFLVLDFDGVLTDNRVWVSQDGSEAVLCHRGDGLGLDYLRRAGIPVVVLSTEKNPVVSARCQKLGLPCFQGVHNKIDQLKEIVKEYGFDLEEVAFVGNDINDLPCMKEAGLAIAVADAEQSVRAAADFITEAPGGHGAVREVAELLLQSRERG